MERIKHQWKRVPAGIRRPVVLVVGTLFSIASVLTGWLPGPGGIPLFLVGIAILATEFEQAQKFRDVILGWIHTFGKWYRRNRVLGTILLVFCATATISIAIYSFNKLH